MLPGIQRCCLWRRWVKTEDADTLQLYNSWRKWIKQNRHLALKNDRKFDSCQYPPRHSPASSFLFMSLWLVTIHVPLFCIAVLKPAFPICLYEWFPLGLHKATSVLWMKLRNKIPQHPTTLLITFYVFIPRVAAPVRLPSLLRLWILFCRLNWVFYPLKSYASAIYIFRPR